MVSNRISVYLLFSFSGTHFIYFFSYLSQDEIYEDERSQSEGERQYLKDELLAVYSKPKQTHIRRWRTRAHKLLDLAQSITKEICGYYSSYKRGLQKLNSETYWSVRTSMLGTVAGADYGCHRIPNRKPRFYWALYEETVARIVTSCALSGSQSRPEDMS